MGISVIAGPLGTYTRAGVRGRSDRDEQSKWKVSLPFFGPGESRKDVSIRVWIKESQSNKETHWTPVLRLQFLESNPMGRRLRKCRLGHGHNTKLTY